MAASGCDIIFMMSMHEKIPIPIGAKGNSYLSGSIFFFYLHKSLHKSPLAIVVVTINSLSLSHRVIDLRSMLPSNRQSAHVLRGVHRSWCLKQAPLVLH